MLKRLLSTDVCSDRVHIVLALLRVTAGGIMLTHGSPKFFQLLRGDFGFADPLGIGEFPTLLLTVLAEFFASILLMLGLGTRIQSLLLAFTMFVAGFVQHFDDPFARKEKAVLFMIIFLVTFVLGGGKYSLDIKLKNKIFYF